MAIELVQKGKETVPVLQGTRVRILDIGIESEYLGKSPDEIVRAHPKLTLAQVHEALAYFYQHIREMREKLKRDQTFVERLKLHYPRKLLVPA